MKDNDPLVKSFAHKMHSCLHFKSRTGFEKIVAVLIAELNERESLKDEVMEALSFLSKNHAIYVKEILSILFGLQEGLLPKECALGDLAHQAHLVMIFNAASSLPEIISHLPSYIVNRFDFMRACYPSIIPTVSHIRLILQTD